MLSLSMIVRNEADRLTACLESVRDCVDEMVVVDTGSEDATAAVARAAGATVHTIDWPGDFAPARNQALRWVRGDWVLVLDADEQLRREAIPVLRGLMAQPDVLLVNLLRFERGARQSPYSSVSRLFRRHPAIRWSRPYHAMVDDSVRELIAREPRWRVAECPEPALIHDGYHPDQLARGDKARRLRRAMEQELEQHPGDPYACSKLAGLEIAEGRLRQGLELLQEGLDHCSREAVHERYELLLHRGMALAGADAAAARASYEEALSLPLPPRLSMGARLNLAALHLRLGDRGEALRRAGEVTRLAPEVALGWYNLGLVRRQAGDLAGALSAYEQARRLDPHHPETHQNLAVAQLLGGDLEASRASFLQAVRLLERAGRLREAEALRERLQGLVTLEAGERP
jgi:Flp pilus assembly protein TadD